MYLSNYYVDVAAERLNTGHEVCLLMKTVDRELAVELPLVKNNGEIEVLHGYRVQHNNCRGPNFGGIAYHPAVNIDSCREMSSLHTWMSALVDIPFGGAYGGVSCEPSKYQERELERLTRLYTGRIDCVIRPQVDIPCRDLNTDEQIMAWMMDEYGHKHGYQPACVTGKPLKLFGSEMSQESAGYGVALTAIETAKRYGYTLKDCTAIVIGFGNTGSHAANFLYELGCKVIAVGEMQVNLYNPDGLNILALMEFVEENGTIVGFPGGKSIEFNDLIALPCDFLIPAAIGGQIDAKAADKIQARIIIEGALAPITQEADGKLTERGIHIIPDILAASGRLIVSYFEWIQNIQLFRWDRESIQNELGKIIVRSFGEVSELSRELKISNRLAAYIVAVDRVAVVTKLRGY